MISTSSDLLAYYRKRNRDFVALYEIYPHDYVPAGGSILPWDPRDATRRFSTTAFSTNLEGDTVTYTRAALSGSAIKHKFGKELDTASVTLSNVHKDDEGRRMLARFILTVDIQGMILVIRWIPRTLLKAPGTGGWWAMHDSVIMFVGKLDKPDDFDRAQGVFNAKQYFGRIEAQVPPGLFTPGCQLKFKGPGCLGNETMVQKSLTYQAAKTCNKTEAQCVQYDNRKMFQGLSVLQLASSFIYRPHRGLFTRIINIAVPLSIPVYNALRRRTVVGNSIHDGTPYGQPIPMSLGRTWKKLIPIQFQDTGEQMYAKMIAGRGPIGDFIWLQQHAPNFSQPLSVTEHLGEFGGVGTQTADTVFPDHSFHSKLAYVTLGVSGSDIETEDPAPDVSALIDGIKMLAANMTNNDGTATLNNEFAGYHQTPPIVWRVSGSDNPVDQAYWLLTDSEMFNIPTDFIWQKGTARTSAYSTGPIKDVTNCERVLLPNSQVGKAGVDYKRWMSTSIVGPRNWDFAFNLSGIKDREAVYEYYDEAAPPTALDVQTVYRKRYSNNLEVTDAMKAMDLLHDIVLPSFRGFIKHDQWGRIWVDNERPADNTSMRVASAPGATSIKVKDVTPWRRFEPLLTDFPPPLQGKLLVGAHKSTSEVRSITSVKYSADGDAITIDGSGTGGITISPNTPTLEGGGDDTPSTGILTVSGVPLTGDTATAVIDGFEVTVTMLPEIEDVALPRDKVTLLLIYAINAEPILQDYVTAYRGSVDEVVIASKYGELLLSSPALEQQHLTELPDPVDPPSASTSAGSLAAGTWLLAYSWRNSNGNTLTSPLLAVQVTGTKQIDVDAVTPPAGADSVDWFLSVEANSDVMVMVLNNDGSGFSFDAVPDPTAALTPLRNETGEECMRVQMSFAGKALTYADTTRANIEEGSFKWPGGSQQSTVNQVKAEFVVANMDFAKQPLVVNDERHQEQVGGLPNSINIDLRGVDNFNAAKRLCNGALAKLRDLDYFFKWESGHGEALLLQVGDVVCASDDSGEWRNQPMRVEDPSFSEVFIGAFNARKYAKSAYDDKVEETQVPLSAGLDNWMGPPPCPEFNSVDFPPDGLTRSTDGVGGITSVRGGITFGSSVYGQRAIVSVKRPLSLVWEIVAEDKTPDENGEAVFEFIASTVGVYTVKLTVVSQFGVRNETCEPEAVIAIGLGAVQGDWDMPVIQMDGVMEAVTELFGEYDIPVLELDGGAEGEPFGEGSYDIPMGGP